MKLQVLPYVTVEIDDRVRRRLRLRGERLRVTLRGYLRSAADDVDTAGDRVRGMCDRAVDREHAHRLPALLPQPSGGSGPWPGLPLLHV